MIDKLNLDEFNNSDILPLTTEIVAAHIANNPVQAEELPHLIRQIHGILTDINAMKNRKLGPRNPAVPVEESVTDDYIVCLEDGKKMKMLKRHLMTSFGMTCDEYRVRWSLPLDYPMVAPNYAKKRSSLAKSFGLGRGRKKVSA